MSALPLLLLGAGGLPGQLLLVVDVDALVRSEKVRLVDKIDGWHS